MMIGHEDSWYQFEDIEMLAYKVSDIFTNDANQSDMRYSSNLT